MKSKKILGSGLVLTAALALAACGSNNSATKESKYKDLVVDTQEFSGDFFGGSFSNSAYDTQVINLTNATGTVSQDGNGKFFINKGIVTDEKVDRTTDEDGNTVITWHLRKDLKWSDGQPIKAQDYVFSTLLNYSPAWTEAGAQVAVETALVGAEAYNSGESDALKGMKVIDDYTFSLTIDKNELPYFFEMALFGAGAVPMHELAPNATLVQTDAGVKVDGDLKAIAENVKTTQVDSKKPTVTYGKYNFDQVSDTEVVLKLNPNYVGNFEGVKPTIETITLKANKNSELAVQRLQKGEVDFVPQLTDASLIKAATEDTKNIGTINYNRNGYGYLGMANEFGPTADVNVRHAIGHLVNRNQLITDVLSGTGVVINGQYSNAQWMAKEKESELNSKLNKYEYSVEKANEALDQSDYKYEADGKTPFDASKASADYLRYNSKKEVLEIKHLGTDNNPVTTSLETNLLVDAPKVGMKYTIVKTDFPTLQKEMNLVTTNSSSAQYHLYNLASNFVGAVVDPYNAEHSKNLGTRANPWRVNDKEIDRLSEEMRKTEATDTEGFANKWLAYQVRFNEILPILPLYSNTYYDAYSLEKVETDPSTAIRNWSTLVEYFRLK